MIRLCPGRTTGDRVCALLRCLSATLLLKSILIIFLFGLNSSHRGCRAGMGIASLLLPENSVFCYVVSREAAGEAPVTLEDAHAVTSAPLVRNYKDLHGVQQGRLQRMSFSSLQGVRKHAHHPEPDVLNSIP